MIVNYVPTGTFFITISTNAKHGSFRKHISRDVPEHLNNKEDVYKE